jgi:hypothetical protein
MDVSCVIGKVMRMSLFLLFNILIVVVLSDDLNISRRNTTGEPHFYIP